MKATLSLLLTLCSLFLFGQTIEKDYIKKHAKLAVQEMHLYKIPASITLAQGLLETGGGQSRLAEKANNHFGIKCTREWTGAKIYHDDDARGECFRKYPSVNDSYRDHSKFLAERPYYKKLFTLPLTDYKAWARGLKKAGYATNPKYAGILIQKIEKHQLEAFDHLQTDEVYPKLIALYGPMKVEEMIGFENDPHYLAQQKAETAKPKEQELVSLTETSLPKKTPEKKTIVVVENKKRESKKMEIPKRKINPRARIKRHENRLDYIVAEPTETLEEIAKTYKTSIQRLRRYNDLEKGQKLMAGQLVFFCKKRNKGAQRLYTAKKGETAYWIAQKMGIKLKKLYRRNRMDKGQEIKEGDLIYLQGRKPKKRN